ncbi:sodium-dependent bicarbonate transport family permease [Noviherbaspirillum denitrificans]|uniref:Sodium-dependent bicarbonate transport family permease n=1 Tax=Noviherbaspirillum denitrificans TaxID=1968433 RepID=A0A254TAA7_9BURK|nr:sodium-dependent bicarbonate transport family permease [Noviherbaspirillum denitrificans]OWW18232.1 sodium-dependent bicarbonate transport family permease [Noviherbaspirillum denitrificans]
MQNFLDPVILFFLFGMFAGSVKSNLEIPPQIGRFLSLYLLMALGLKGGFALAKSGLGADILTPLACAIFLAFSIPLIGYWLLKKILRSFDAAALAATYGSVSAVTFITATQYLDKHDVAFGGHMAAAMALMESPAILVSLVFASVLRQREVAASGFTISQGAVVLGAGNGPALPSLKKVVHEALTDGTQLLLLGALLIGLLTGETGKAAMQPFSGDLFKGMLAFFLLDMGLHAARSLKEVNRVPAALYLYAIAGPLLHALLALVLCRLLAINMGDGILLMVLAASASYIAVPAVLRHAMPEARIALYTGLPLAITFPFNVLAGIPLYAYLGSSVLR